jgi:hypothetical protein
MAEQIKNLTTLIAQQMNPTQNQSGYGGYYQQPQSMAAQPQMPPQYRQWVASQSTPSRTNGGRGGGRGSRTNRGQDKKTNREVNSQQTQMIEEEPMAKRTDDKSTPTKATPHQLQLPPEREQQRIATHPYEIARQLQYDQGMNAQYMPFNYQGHPAYYPAFANHAHSPDRGRQDPRENSPYYMVPPSEDQYRYSQDTHMQDNHSTSHLAEDATQHTQL